MQSKRKALCLYLLGSIAEIMGTIAAGGFVILLFQYSGGRFDWIAEALRCMKDGVCKYEISMLVYAIIFVIGALIIKAIVFLHSPDKGDNK